MKIIIRGRQQGKTTELIKLAAEEWLYIICPSKMQACNVAKQAIDLGVDIPYPLTWLDYVNGNYYGKGINGFAIDNLDMCIQHMSSVPVKAITLSLTKIIFDEASYFKENT